MEEKLTTTTSKERDRERKNFKKYPHSRLYLLLINYKMLPGTYIQNFQEITLLPEAATFFEYYSNSSIYRKIS